ncbi:MAG: 30S ribosomal protein S8 [Patescibacteria group bacterium]
MATIADILTQIKNAYLVGKSKVELPYSKLREELAKLLVKEGFLEDYKIFKPQGSSCKYLSLTLRYIKDEPTISKIELVSHPGQRIYSGAKDLPDALRGRGLVVVSTSRGLLSAEEARKKNLGGEVLCKIW